MTAVTSFSDWYGRRDPVTIIVSFEEREHWKTTGHRGRPMKAYAVMHEVDGGVVELGRVEHAVESTDTKIGRLRRPGLGRLAWAWRARNGEASGTLYCRTRQEAACRMVTALRQGENKFVEDADNLRVLRP